MTPNGVGLLEWTAIGGSSKGVRTDAVGYPIGSTSISLSPGGTGKITKGQSVYFNGDNTRYVVTNDIPDVSLGGTLTLLSGLQQAIPATATPVYTGGELKRGWGHNLYYSPTGIVAGAVAPAWRDWYESGEVVQMWFDKGYSVFDHKHRDFITRSTSMTNITQVKVLGELEKWAVGMEFIFDDTSSGNRSDLLALESYMDVWVNGVKLAWFPDRSNRPELFYWVVLENRGEPRRMGNLAVYSIEFTLVQEHQFSYSIPAFV